MEAVQRSQESICRREGKKAFNELQLHIVTLKVCTSQCTKHNCKNNTHGRERCWLKSRYIINTESK